MEEKECCLCGSDIKGICEDLYTNNSKHSNLLLYEVLRKILKHNWIKQEENLACYVCINRLNKYEFGMMLAKEMEEEILESVALNDRSKIVLLDDLKEDVQVEMRSEVGGNDDSDHIIDEWLVLKDDNNSNEDEEHKPDVYTIENSENCLYTEEDNDNLSPKTLSLDITPLGPKKSRQRQYFCEKCVKLFPSLSDFQQHKEFEHKKSIVSLQCHKCGVTCATAKKLNNHMRSHQNPIKCPICNKEITQKGALKRHMVIHTGEKSYQCDICGKAFIHRSSFRMHNLSHGNIREVTCQICGYKLRSRSHLSRHMLIHTGEKRHECPKCGQKFAQRYNMSVHLKLHEGIRREKPKKKYICFICDLKFKTLKALNEHNGNVHSIGKKELELENVIEDQS